MPYDDVVERKYYVDVDVEKKIDYYREIDVPYERIVEVPVE
jgi:hypothetical protein